MKAYDLLLLSPKKKQKTNKLELHFGHGLCWPRFCPNRVLKQQFVKVLAIFFSELQYYNISYRYLFNFLTFLNGNQQKYPKWVDLMGKIWPNLTTEDNIKEVPLTWSASPQKNWMMKIKNFHGAGQSNNMVFAGLWLCETVMGGFLKIFICKLHQIYHDLILKSKL